MHSQSRSSQYKRIFKQTIAINLLVWEVWSFYLLPLFLFPYLSHPQNSSASELLQILCLSVLQIRVCKTPYRLKLENSSIKYGKKVFNCVCVSDFTAPQVNLAGQGNKCNWFPVTSYFHQVHKYIEIGFPVVHISLVSCYVKCHSIFESMIRNESKSQESGINPENPSQSLYLWRQAWPVAILMKRNRVGFKSLLLETRTVCLNSVKYSVSEKQKQSWEQTPEFSNPCCQDSIWITIPHKLFSSPCKWDWEF